MLGYISRKYFPIPVVLRLDADLFCYIKVPVCWSYVETFRKKISDSGLNHQDVNLVWRKGNTAVIYLISMYTSSSIQS